MPTVNVLLLKDEQWSAQCLEHDIAAQGSTINEAMEELSILLAAEACVGESSLQHIPPAPQQYWSIFKQAHSVTNLPAFPVVPLSSVPPPFMLPEFRELRVA